MEDTGTTVCYRHPGRATRLSCSNCGRPICAECSHDAAVGQRCPECSRPEGRHRVITSRQAFGGPSMRTTPVTFWIIGICVALFLPQILSPELNRSITNDLALIGPAVAQGEWWRAVTAAFLHVGSFHILFNMYALYILGPQLEREIGSLPFAAFYLAAAVAGNAMSYALEPLGSSVGASGAIFGLFGAWMWVGYRLRHTPAGAAMFNQMVVLLVINAAIPLLIPNIDWRAHAGGLVAGLAMAALWGRFAAGRPDARRRRVGIAAVVLVLALAVVFFV